MRPDMELIKLSLQAFLSACALMGIAFLVGLKVGIFLEDKFDLTNRYNYRRVHTPGGKVILLPRKQHGRK